MNIFILPIPTKPNIKYHNELEIAQQHRPETNLTDIIKGQITHSTKQTAHTTIQNTH